MRFHRFIQDVLGDPAHWACLRQLQQQSPLSGRELAKRTAVSQFKIRRVLDNLSSQGLLKKEAHGPSHLYSLNKRHYLVQKITPLLDLERNFLSFFGEWVFRHLSEKPLSIILFGSVARGEERPNSDIDLLFIYGQRPLQEEKVDRVLLDSAEDFGNRVSSVFMTPPEFQKGLRQKKAFFLNVLKDGIVLKGLSKQEILQ